MDSPVMHVLPLMTALAAVQGPSALDYQPMYLQNLASIRGGAVDAEGDASGESGPNTSDEKAQPSPRGSKQRAVVA